MANIKGIEFKEGMFVAVYGMEVKNDNDIYVVDCDYSIEGKYAICRDELCLKKVKLNGEMSKAKYNICFVNERIFRKNPNMKIEIITDLKVGKKTVNNYLKNRENKEVVTTFEESKEELKVGSIVKFSKTLVCGTFGDTVIGTKRMFLVKAVEPKLQIIEVGVKGQELSNAKYYSFTPQLTEKIHNEEYLIVLDKKETLKEELNKIEAVEEKKEEVKKVTTIENTSNIEGVEVIYNDDKNGIEITFASKELATEEIRTELKAVGFRYFFKLGKWIAKQNNETIATVNKLFRTVTEENEVEVIEVKEKNVSDVTESVEENIKEIKSNNIEVNKMSKTKISISEKVYNGCDVHPALRREEKIIIHDGWQWYMGHVEDEKQLNEMLEFFDMELTSISNKVEHETTGKIITYNLSKDIENYNCGFWNIEQLKEFSNNSELKKLKGLSNGSIVDCYAEIKEDKVVIYRPNPNAKEVYKEMSLNDEIEFRKNNWYI